MARAERQLELLTRDKRVVEAKLADPALYRGPTVEITLLKKQLAELEHKITAVEKAWLAAEEAMN